MFYTNSTFFARMPYACEVVFLQTAQVYLKSVFLLVLAPVRFHLVIAGLENLPQLPTPLPLPRSLARYFEPRLNELLLRFLF